MEREKRMPDRIVPVSVLKDCWNISILQALQNCIAVTVHTFLLQRSNSSIEFHRDFSDDFIPHPPSIIVASVFYGLNLSLD